MATTQKIYIDPQDTGLWKVKQTEESAQKASELLQKDLEQHHVFFNEDGFHNHIVHHILTLYGTGANAAHLQKGFDDNTGYQRPAKPNHQRVIRDLQSWDHAKDYLAKEQYYPDFLAFFQQEISTKGWEAVMSEYLFAGTEAADDLLARLFGGFLHPLIQLMYGMEWKQPAIVAEALAQACVHRNDYKGVLLTAEKNANEHYARSGARMPTIVSLLEETRRDPKLSTSIRTEDGNKIRDGVLRRAPDEMLKVISKVRVGPDELEERTVEMFNACMYMAAGATFHPPKTNKFDFFLIHHVNVAPIFLTINAAPWIPAETKARLMEWKIRMDLIQYAGRGVPSLPLDEIKAYTPKKSGSASVAEIVSRLHGIPDDGHAIKLARAAVLCHEVSKKYEDRDWINIKDDDTWMKVHHLIADSVEAPGPDWVRTAGLDDAWNDVPDKPKL